MGDNLSTVKQTLSTSDIRFLFLFFCEIRIKPFLTNFTFSDFIISVCYYFKLRYFRNIRLVWIEQ
jgi:hypothetical protein